MILRLIRARIARDREADVFGILRRVSAGVARPPGLDSIHVARRVDDDGNHIVAVTVWSDIAALEGALGPAWASRFLPQLDGLLEDLSIEHFETIVDRYDQLPTLGT